MTSSGITENIMYPPKCLMVALLATVTLGLAMTQPVLAQNDDRRIVQEDIEWCDVWLPHLNEHALPRVLLIGDSITRAYYPQVEKLLAGKAYVGRLSTSRSVGDIALVHELEAVLGKNQFDVIHFNNGMHGWGFTEAEYGKYFPELLDTIRKYQPKAKLIWGNITPARVNGKVTEVAPLTERIKARNAIALEIVTHEKIPVNDLFNIGFEHSEFYSNDGVHFNDQGSEALAEKVAAAVTANLK